MSTYTFTVPLPPRGCSSNGNKGSWRKKHTATKAYAEDVFVECLKAQTRPLWKAHKVRVSLLFGIKGGRVVGRYQPRDIPNAVDAFKAGFDGMVGAQLFPDDDAKHMALGTVAIDSTVGPWVRVTVEAIE